MGVLGEEAFRRELDESRWENLLCDEVPLGVDELGGGRVPEHGLLGSGSVKIL